jgi:hypothetical protein
LFVLFLDGQSQIFIQASYHYAIPENNTADPTKTFIDLLYINQVSLNPLHVLELVIILANHRSCKPCASRLKASITVVARTKRLAATIWLVDYPFLKLFLVVTLTFSFVSNFWFERAGGHLLARYAVPQCCLVLHFETVFNLANDIWQGASWASIEYGGRWKV